MIKTHTLKNGITIVLENLPHFSSTAIGVWFKTGSSLETVAENGISHLVEHMLFKGTNTRSAKDIAIAFDKIGGHVNAFTSKEITCYYAKVVSSEIETATDILADLVKNSVLDANVLDKERLVVLEEISMVNDQPDDLAHEQISIDYFNGTEYAKPIIGPAKNVKRFSRNDLTNYMSTHYCPQNMVISVAGKLDEPKILSLLQKHFSDITAPQNAKKASYPSAVFAPQKTITVLPREIEQTHIALGFKGTSFTNDDKTAYMVLSNLFGGSMSSRLFQSIREDMGLVYSVYTYLATYSQTGMFGIYAATGAKTAETAMDRIIKEVKLLKDKGVSQEAFDNSKTQIHGNYMLSLESTASRMQSIGKSQALLGYVESKEDVLKRLEAVSLDDIHRIITNVFDFDTMNAAFIGNIANEKALRDLC